MPTQDAWSNGKIWPSRGCDRGSIPRASIGSEGWRSSVPRGPLAQSAEQRPGRTKAPGSSPGGVHSCVTGLTWRGHWPSKPVVPVRIRGDACGLGAYEYRQAAFNRKIAGSNPVRPSLAHAWESPMVGEPGCYPGCGRFESFPRRSGHCPRVLAFVGPSSTGRALASLARGSRFESRGRPSAVVAEWPNAPARRAGQHRFESDPRLVQFLGSRPSGLGTRLLTEL